MDDAKREKRDSLLTEIAHMYYIQNLSQDEISKRLFLSRSRISRMLNEARERNLIEFHIKYPGVRNYPLENFLTETMGLKAARVYNDIGHTDQETFEGVCHFAAEYIKPLLTPNMKIGVTHNVLMAAVVGELTAACRNTPPLNLNMVQLIGNHVSPPVGYSAQDIMCKMVAHFGGTVNLLNIPVYISNTMLRTQLLHEPMIASTLSVAKEIDLAIIGVKAIGSSEQLKKQVIWAGYLDDTEIDNLIEIGTCGHILGKAIDVNGNLIVHPINDSIMGMDPANLRQVKDSICVATGAERGRVMHGTIKGGYINTLITDRSCAQEIVNTFFNLSHE